MRIAFGTDEETSLTDAVVVDLAQRGHDVERVAPGEPWPEVGRAVGEAVAAGRADRGVVCCWTGTGVSIAANKVVGVPLNVPLHPSQLYESAALFAICGVLLWIFHRRDSSAQPAGQTFAAYLMLYGAARFLLEYTRDLSEDPVILNLFSLSQVIALALVVDSRAIRNLPLQKF